MFSGDILRVDHFLEIEEGLRLVVAHDDVRTDAVPSDRERIRTGHEKRSDSADSPHFAEEKSADPQLVFFDDAR